MAGLGALAAQNAIKKAAERAEVERLGELVAFTAGGLCVGDCIEEIMGVCHVNYLFQVCIEWYGVFKWRRKQQR